MLVGENGNWSEDGCRVADINETLGIITCECDHLTNFAIIVVISPINRIHNHI